MQLIRLPDVMARTALSRTAIYDLMAKQRFPRPVKLGGNLNAWPIAEIDGWIESRIAERESAA